MQHLANIFKTKKQEPVTGRGLIAIQAVSLLLLLGLSVPWLPDRLLPHDVDSSWILVLHYAFSNGLRWGHDLVWHYGPLGFLYGRFYYPATFHTMLALYAFLSVLFWAGARELWMKTRLNPLAMLAAAALAMATFEVLFFGFPLLLILLYVWDERRLRNPVFTLLLIGCAVSGMVKFSYFLCALSAVGLIEIHRVSERRMPGLVLLPFLAYCALCWALCGQQFGDIPTYVRGAMELGYGFEAMAMQWHPAHYVVLYASVVLAWLFAATQVIVRNGRTRDAALFAVAILAQLYVVIKAEFLHDNDHHLIQALGWFFLLALLSKDFFWEQRSRLATVLITLCTLVSLYIVAADYVLASLADKKQGGFAYMFTSTRQAMNTLETSETNSASIFGNRQKFEATRASIRADYDLPVTGTADIYNVYQATLLAQPGAIYRPRPVYQSYHAYTPFLAQQNRDFLRSDAAPDHLLFSPDWLTGIGRYPSIDDGLSWPELLARYDVTQVKNSYAMLDRRSTPHSITFTPLTQANAQLGQPLAVPAIDGLLWAKVTIRPTWQGRLLRFLYKLQPVTMRFELATGYTRTDRVTPDVIGEGFLLSPLVDNAWQFAMLADADRAKLIARNRLVNIRFDTGRSWIGALYRSAVDVKFYRLDIAPQPQRPQGWCEAERYTLITSGMPAQGERYSIPYPHLELMAKQGHQFISVFDNGTVALPVAADEQALSLSLGSFLRNNKTVGMAGPITVTIAGHRGTRTTQLWQATLPALENQSASDPLAVSLHFPPGRYDTLTIETHPLTKSGDHWVYLGDLELR